MSKTMQAYRGSLDLYYQVEDSNGDFGAVYSGGNVTDFEIIPEAEELEVISTANDTYGQAADTMVDAKPTKSSFTANRFNIDLWAVAFMGEIAARAGAGGTVDVGTPEDVEVVLGEMAILANRDVSSVVVKDVTDTTTYVEDTDYTIVDAALGILKFLSTGSIGDGDTLHVSYTFAAESGFLLSGGTESSKFLKIWGRGVNRFNNKRAIVNIPRCSVKPSGGFSLVGTDAASIQFDLTVNVPTDGSAPFTVITDD